MFYYKLIEKKLNEINKRSKEGISLILPNGKKLGSGKNNIFIKDNSTIINIIKDIEHGFCEAYVDGKIEVDNDLFNIIVDSLKYTCEVSSKTNPNYLFYSAFRHILKLLNLSKKFDEINVRRHYDLDNDFFKLWLDKSMTYSCAFFENTNVDLEQAQEEKRNIIFKKLLLNQKDILLDIGCGWGSLIIDAAKKYKCKSIGITVSKNQYEYVKEQIKKENLNNLAEVYLMHYKELPDLNIKFNKIVSVGMFEHVGREHLDDFFKICNSVLDNKGLFLLHYIGKLETVKNQQNWITKRIFPGGYLPSLEEVFPMIKKNNFGFIDLDNWRLHYYYTLMKWYERFEKVKTEVVKKFSEEFFRMWELYLLGSAALYYIGDIYLFQILMSKGVNNDYPVIKRNFL